MFKILTLLLAALTLADESAHRKWIRENKGD